MWANLGSAIAGLALFLAAGRETFAADPGPTPSAAAKQILDAAGVQGGLVVHLGCGDGRLTAALRAGRQFLVQGLDGDADAVASARRYVETMGLGGAVSIDCYDGRHLPYADNLVNLIVAADGDRVADAEMLRVLVPRGVARVKRDGRWQQIVKPWPADIDQWTHFLHDASNNAVAHDRQVAAPRRLQWLDGPLWSRSHEYDSSLGALVSAQGRQFCIFDEGPTGIVDPRIPDHWSLIARDAFNGIVLWKRPVPDWGWTAWKRKELEHADWSRMASQRTRLPLAVPRRLVADGDRVYVTLGYQAPLSVLDAATGRTLTTYPGTERTDEIVLDRGRLVLCIRETLEGREPPPKKSRKDRAELNSTPATLLALDAATGRRLWQTGPGPLVPLSLAVHDSRVLYHDTDAVVCLDAASGKRLWRTPTEHATESIWNTGTTLVAYRNVVLCSSWRHLVALSARDGARLWELPGARGFGAANPPDLFVADGLVWYGQGHPEIPSITGYDPLTGKPARQVDLGELVTRGHHPRCYRSKATDNYLFLSKRGVELIDVRGGENSRNNWVRGACRYGIVPCNGLLYSTPHPCFCYAGVKLGGFLALSSAQVNAAHGPDSPALVRGPAYAISGPTASLDAASQDWPEYRHDSQRSGSTLAAIAGPLHPLWRNKLGGKLTQPLAVGGRVFVACADAGRVCCLDAATGKLLWDYLAGGRVDSPPAYYRGRLLFGSADGCVYCLRASDGALAWQLPAAPEARQIVACGQLESAWPIHGSVLLLDGVAYFVVGRSSFLDGGLLLYGVDPLSGATRYQTRIEGPYPDTKRLDENAYAMEGAKSDILVTDGKLIYLFQNVFNARLEKQPCPVQGQPGVRNLGVREFGQHLFSNCGFLDDSWFSRTCWMYGDHWPAFNFANQSPKAGQLVVFDRTDSYAVQCFPRRNLLSPLFFPATDGCFLFADRNETRPLLVSDKAQPGYHPWLPQTEPLQVCWNLNVGFARPSNQPAKWVTSVPVRIRALLRTQGAIFAAGTPDLCEPDDPLGALEGRKGALLMTFNPDDGRKLDQCQLDAAPAFDGMSAAAGRLYLVGTDGQVSCFGRR